MKDSWAIILAAGFSTRMGTQKLLLPYKSSTIIETVVDHVLESSIDKIMIVLGNDKDEITRALGNKPVEFCHNPHPENGMLSSVKCGFKSLPEESRIALVYLGDQPGIPPFVTNKIIEAYNEALHGIVIPVFKQRRGHPLLVDMKYRKEIEKLDLEKGLRSLIRLFPSDILEVEVDERGILVDIDTKEDYNNATKHIS